VARRPAAVVHPSEKHPEKPTTEAPKKSTPQPQPKARSLPEPSPRPSSVQAQSQAPPSVPERPQPKTGPPPEPQPAQPQARTLSDSLRKLANAGPQPKIHPGLEAAGSTGERARSVEAQPPRYGYRSEPEYPRLAIRRGYEGTTLLRVHILEDGRVTAVEVKESSGFQMLDEAARKAVETWRFTPGLSAGQPKASWVLVPITFKLE
jgi:protein TonB